jgi:transcriptional repressor NrdR
MRCPKCSSMETKVVDSRTIDDGQSIRRRRECEYCWHRFTTFEKKEVTELTVVKKDWTKEMYDRQKLKKAILLSFAKRKYISEEIDNMISWLETKRSQESSEIESRKIGTDVLNAIKEIDLVAYVRFASVYNSFETTEDFQKLLQD